MERMDDAMDPWPSEKERHEAKERSVNKEVGEKDPITDKERAIIFEELTQGVPIKEMDDAMDPWPSEKERHEAKTRQVIRELEAEGYTKNAKGIWEK